MLWENGGKTNEPLKIFDKDVSIDCASYTKKHVLLKKPGWRKFKRLAKRKALIVCLVKQAGFWSPWEFNIFSELISSSQLSLSLNQFSQVKYLQTNNEYSSSNLWIHYILIPSSFISSHRLWVRFQAQAKSKIQEKAKPQAKVKLKFQ